MAQSRRTPRVWSDAIRGSEIVANWLKLGTSAVFFWLSIGVAVDAAVGQKTKESMIGRSVSSSCRQSGHVEIWTSTADSLPGGRAGGGGGRRLIFTPVNGASWLAC